MEIVAEFTYNHLGNLDRARKMIDAAKAVGATCVKFEMRNNDSYFRNYESIRDRKQGYEFTDEAIAGFVNHCKEVSIEWFASVHDIHSLMKVIPLKPRYLKIASREARIIPFLSKFKEVNGKAFPVIVSTGGLSFKQVEEIYELMKDEKLTMLHTSCLYPCEPEYLNMNRIRKMKERFNCNIGYSGHERGYLPSLYAATLGVSYIERHFTLEDKVSTVAKGKEDFKDELCTLGPIAFKEMVNAIELFRQLHNQETKDKVTEQELSRVNAYGIPSWDGEDVYVR